MRELSLVLSASEWISQNTLPTRFKVPAVSKLPGYFGENAFDPDLVDLGDASGNFSTVVEFSAGLCLRMFDTTIQSFDSSATIPARDLYSYLSAQTTPFVSGGLNSLKNRIGS